MLTNRRKIRTILNATDTTSETLSIHDSPLSFVLTTADSFYVGFHEKFSTRYFALSTVNSNSTVLSVNYWDGSAWSSVDDLIDQTSGFTKSGFVSWINEENWQKRELSPIVSNDGEENKLYWIQIKVSADLSAGTALQSVLNLFSDDESVRALYPEFITDARFLPPGRTNFLSQHLEAKNRVVRRMIQKRLIQEESQVIDINEVAEAAIHAFVDIILTPIATSDDMTLILQRARDTFESELSQVRLGLDLDKSGKVSDAERQIDFGVITRR